MLAKSVIGKSAGMVQELPGKGSQKRPSNSCDACTSRTRSVRSA
jgi:hypothetical protein